MATLKRLFDNLNAPEYCRYGTDRFYPTNVSGQVIKLLPLELLEVGRDDPREHIMIGYFVDEPTRILYFGEDASSMLETLKSLKLPKSPSNLGEQVFNIFMQHLEGTDSDIISLEQAVIKGKEHQFKHVLRKLIHIYSGKQINRGST